MSLKHFIGGIALGATLITGFFKADELRQLAREEVKDATCVSAYSHLQKRDKYHEDMPHYVKNTSDYFCAFNGDFDGNGTKENAILVAEPTATFLYPPGSPTDFELYHNKFDRYKICGVGFKPEKFEIKDIGIDKAPQIVLTFSCHNRRRLQILRQNMFREYEKVLDTEADYFALDNYSGSRNTYVAVVNKNSRRPMQIFSWDQIIVSSKEFGQLYGGRFDPFGYHHKKSQKLKSDIIEAVQHGDAANRLMTIVRHESYPPLSDRYIIASAFINTIEESANPDNLYMELFETTRANVIERLGRDPGRLKDWLVEGWVRTDSRLSPPFYWAPTPTKSLKKFVEHLRGRR